jgi:hypothetical protein
MISRDINHNTWERIPLRPAQKPPENNGLSQLCRKTAGELQINLPFFVHRRSFDGGRDPDGTGSPGPVDLDKAEAGRYAESARAEFISRLPKSLGTNVIAISSDLHYLHVYTDVGHCMILGSLQQAADAMGEAGLRVHRAHWVARRAIVKIVKKGRHWYCLLSNGLKIPISRRNKSTVAGWFGHTTRIYPVRKNSTDAS